jgi:hypothetical protein
MRLFVPATVALALAACAMPSTIVRTPDTRPGIAVDGAPPGSTLIVDGMPVGEAALYDGQPDILLVEPGTHVIVIRDGSGNVIHQQKIYVESEIRTIKVH